MEKNYKFCGDRSDHGNAIGDRQIFASAKRQKTNGGSMINDHGSIRRKGGICLDIQYLISNISHWIKISLDIDDYSFIQIKVKTERQNKNKILCVNKFIT